MDAGHCTAAQPSTVVADHTTADGRERRAGKVPAFRGMLGCVWWKGVKWRACRTRPSPNPHHCSTHHPSRTEMSARTQAPELTLGEVARLAPIGAQTPP